MIEKRELQIMKNISVWFNRNGIDECYFEGLFKDYNIDSLKEIIKNCNSLFSEDEDVNEMFNEFDLELEDNGWRMYSFDGIGILVVDEGFDKKKCKKKYDKLVEY